MGKVAQAFNNMTVELRKMIKAREQLLLDVSHELRTPITRAKIALEIMPDSPEKESVTEDMREMELMISELLETERLKSGKANLQLMKTNVKKAPRTFNTELNCIRFLISCKLMLIRKNNHRDKKHS
ncbi:MAG: hypothetical protein HC831_08240 [Chloroflexia bacterium]|nr:hypothetical protein [Chloroflexia bacterium]